MPHINTNDHKINQKTLDDYFTFFTAPQGAHMTHYTYLDSSKLFENLIKHSKDYYLFKDDAMTISNVRPKLKKYLSDILDIVEIGPGCNYSLTHKTIHILNSAANLQNYYAIDNFKPYLDKACSFIKNKTTGIDVHGFNIDFMQAEQLKLNYKDEHNKKCFLLLGSTLGGLEKNQQEHCLKQISNLTNEDDLFILTIDTNQDEESLLKAYNNKYSSDLIKGILRYFSTINTNFSPHLCSFEIKCKWNKLLSFVDMYFVAKKDLHFEHKDNIKIFIKKGQELRGIKAYKYTEEYIVNFLSEYNFKVLEILNTSDRMKLFLCKKVKYVSF